MDKNYIHSFIIGLISTSLFVYLDKDMESYENKELFMNIKPKYIKLFVTVTMTSLFILTTFSSTNEIEGKKLQNKTNTLPMRPCPF